MLTGNKLLSQLIPFLLNCSQKWSCALRTIKKISFHLTCKYATGLEKMSLIMAFFFKASAWKAAS